MGKAPTADDTLRDTAFATALVHELTRNSLGGCIALASPRRGPKRLDSGAQDRRVHAAELFRIGIVA
jgi:hypothetical protein